MKFTNYGKLALAIMLLHLCVSVQAETLYKWVDDDGAVSYHHRPPPDVDGYDVEIKEIRSSDEEGRGLGSTVRAFKYPVTLYTSTKCATCDQARNYLREKKVSFKEKNVQEDQALGDELRKVSGAFSVPVITVGETVVTGFAQRWLESELIKAGYINKPQPRKETKSGETQ